jgi:iron(III) transport system substrate-binding protein
MRRILFALLALLGFWPALAVAETLQIYTAAPADLATALAEAFQKQTGVQTGVFSASTGKIMARLAAEASHPHAEVVILADWTAGLELADTGDVLPYRPARLAEALRPGLQAAGPFLPIGGDVVTIVVNTRALPEGAALPKDWFDLVGPAWKGRLTMPDPRLSGTAADFVVGFVAQYGDRAWQFFDALKAEGCLWPGPNEAAARPVELGLRSAMVAGVGHTAISAEQSGNSLDLVFPSSGLLLIPRPILVMKSAPDAALAEKFVDFALSPAGQQEVAKTLLIPARADTPPAKVWPDLAGMHFLNVDWGALGAQRKAVLARFRHDISGQ